MINIKKPKLSDIYYFCSKLLSKEEPKDETLEVVQANITDMKKMGSFLEQEWLLDRRTLSHQILPAKAAYLTYHLLEGNHFAQRKFIFSLWCGMKMMEENGVKLKKGQFQRHLKVMLRFYSRKKGALYCKHLLREFFSNAYTKNDPFRAFGRLGEEFPRLL